MSTPTQLSDITSLSALGFSTPSQKSLVEGPKEGEK